MKKCFLLFSLIAFCKIGLSQSESANANRAQPAPPALLEDKCMDQRLPLTWPAYKKMMRDHFGFTIVGSQTPVTGFKVETAKPTITIKGNILSSKEKAFIMNLELTGVVQENFMQVFSGTELNSYFKFNLGMNYVIDRGNKAKFIQVGDDLKLLTRKQVCQYREEIEKMLDSFVVLKGLIVNSKSPATFESLASWIMTEAGMPHYNIWGYIREFSPNAEAYYKSLTTALMYKYIKKDSTRTDAENFIVFRNRLFDGDDHSIGVAKLMVDYTKLKQFDPADNKHREELYKDFQIETYKDVWTKKRITWLNLSFMGTNSAFKLYDASSQTITDGKSFLPGASLSFNYLDKYKKPSQFTYLKFALDVQRVNSLRDMPKFDYKQEQTIQVGPETLKSEKTGIAYDGTLRQAVGFDLYMESYFIPWSSTSIPGLYIKPRYSYGDVWLTRSKLSLDLGMVWNVVNNDKEAKNVLSVVPYVNWANLLTEYKDNAKTQTKNLSELFSVGLRFGIPVNVGR